MLLTEGVETVLTPIRAPKANAFAERWVKTVRSDVLDWTLVLGRRHLDRILGIHVRHYNHERPHQGLGLLVPESANAPEPVARAAAVTRRDLLGGLIHEYRAVAA